VQARQLWEKTLNSDPSNSVLWVNMGLALESDGDMKGALEKFRRAAALDPSDKSVYVNIGNVLAAEGDDRAAFDAFRTAIGSSKREQAAYNAFLAAHKMGDVSSARAMLDTLLKTCPSCASTARAKADMCLYDGDTACALRLLENLAERNENDWFILAKIHLARGDTVSAENDLRKLPADGSWQRAATWLRAETAFAMKQYARSHELWRRIDDTSFVVRYNIALSALYAQCYGGALNAALEIYPRASAGERTDVLRVAGNAALGLKKWDDAKKWFREMIDINAGDALARYKLAVATLNGGDPDMAWHHYQQAIQTDLSVRDTAFEKRFSGPPGPVEAHTGLDSLDMLYNSAVEQQTAGNDTLAETQYLRITEANPGYYRAWNNLGAIYSSRGALKDAKKCYRNALDANRGFIEAYANMIGIYAAEKDFRKARKLLQKARENNPGNALIDEIEKSLDEAATRAESEERAGSGD
jgi:tetratricopeptide (TPR) repeat protein